MLINADTWSSDYGSCVSREWSKGTQQELGSRARQMTRNRKLLYCGFRVYGLGFGVWGCGYT